MLIIFFIIFFASINASAQIEINVIGNTKTKASVISTELNDLYLLEKVEEDLINEIERRLWNLRLFAKIKIQKISDKKIQVHLEERWTTIPIAKFSSGGGSSYYSLGIYDINSFGTNTEIGAQYESLNNRAAGVLWLRKPQFLKNRNLKLGFDLWSINRVRFFYDSHTNEDNGAYTLERKRLNAFIEYKWNNDFYNLGFQYDYQDDITSNFGLSDEQNALNEQNNFNPEGVNVSRFHAIYFDIGRLNYKNYLTDGNKLSLRTSLVAVSNDETKNLSSSEITFQHFKLQDNNKNFAWQFKLKHNNLAQIQNLSYLGGLNEVRGYMDGQYFNNSTWQNNFEYRFDLYENKWGVIQGAGFTDQAKEGEDLKDLTERKEEILLSSGFGIRLISPKIFRFVARLDYAQSHTRSVEQGVSLGIQQFF